MPSLTLPLLTLAILIPLVASLFARLGRRGAAGASLFSLAASVAALIELSQRGAGRLADPLTPLLAIDSLGALATVLYCVLVLGVLISAPKRDSQPGDLRDNLHLLAGSLTVYSADNLVVLFAGWVLTVLPMWRSTPGELALRRVILGASTICLAVSFALVYGAGTLSIHELAGVHVSGDQWLSFALLMLAILLRKGIFPFQFWFPVAAGRGPLLKTVLFFNAHLGAFLVARIAFPSMPGASHEGLGPLFDLALLTAVITSLMAMVEQTPRRVLALLAVSHGSFILTGLETGTVEGFTGAMIYWIVVAIATTVIFLVLRMLEVRTTGGFLLDRFHGFGARTPRFAAFFAVCALALVGLPGTLGFWAEDLLLQGALSSHPQLGLMLPIATAINAVTFLRAFARLFLGQRAWRVPALSDAIPRERWVLAAGVVIVVLWGLLPGSLAGFISSRISHPAAIPAYNKPHAALIVDTPAVAVNFSAGARP